MKITNIKEVYNLKNPDESSRKNNKYDELYQGYEIQLDDKIIIHILVEEGSQCCEEFGYISLQDSPNDFIGAEVLNTFYSILDQNNGYEEVLNKTVNMENLYIPETCLLYLTFE